MSSENIGIAGHGVYLPQGRVSASDLAAKAGLAEREVVEELGVVSKTDPAREDQPQEMARLAGAAALAQAGMDPLDVNLVLWSGEEYKDYIAQTASIRLQKEVGATNAWAFDLVGQGTTLVTGLRVAAALMRGDAEIKTVLIAGGSRNCDLVDPANPDTRWLLDCSAAGGAVVLQRGIGKNLLLGFGMDVAADLSDEVAVPAGGTGLPFSLEVLNGPDMYYQVENPGLVTQYWDKQFAAGLCRAVEQALKRAGLAGRGIDFLAGRHLPPAQQKQVAARLGLADGQTANLADLGFTGAADPVISLDRGLAQGAVAPGRLVALAGSGHGFCHAAALVKWGE